MSLKAILLLDSPLISTGYASTCRLTAKELKKRGHDVYGISFNGGPQNNDVMDWYGIKVLPNTALKRNVNAMYGDAQLIIEIFNQHNPDILFFHNDSYRYSYIKELPQNVLDRCVFWLPFEGEMPDNLGVELFSKCLATRFVTYHALNIHSELLKGKDIGYIPHSIDFESYFPIPDNRAAKAAKQLGLDDKFVVLRVDRHQPRKYWDLTLEAFAKFAANKTDVFLLGKCNPRDIVMYNAEKKEGIDLDEIGLKLGLKGKFFFDDFFFSSPAMAQCFFHAADVFLTTTSGEGFGLTPVEAMACGLPVICPETPVLPEVLQDGGIYCKIKKKEWYTPMNVWHNIVDVDDVAAKLEWAYNDWKNNGSVQLKEIGMKGRAIAEQKYSPNVVYDQWDKVFKDVSERKDLVSMVTVLYNIAGESQLYGEDGIDKFRESMEKHVTHPYEWIIVDNGSPSRIDDVPTEGVADRVAEATKINPTRRWLEQAAAKNPRIKPVYLDTNMGFAGGCNAGIAAARGSSIILANPDCEALNPKKLNLYGDFIKMMSDRAKSDPYIGIIGMTLNRRDDVLTGSMFPYFCNVLITRTCLDACKISENKWLNEEFWPAYYEDLDFVMRAMGKGFKVVEHNVPFWHKSGGTNKHAIEGGSKGPYVKHIENALATLEKYKPEMADFKRKRGELEANGMQGLIAGNIEHLRNKWGPEARQKIKIVWDTHIGAAVGFSQIAEGLAPELHKLGFDVYINDWSNGSNVEDPLIRQLIEKTRKTNEESDDLDNAIHIVCWLMETFLNVDADYKVGISLCESTKVRPQYLQACNQMDRILTFSDFCRNVQKDSKFSSPIHVIPPGVHPIFINYYERPIRDKYSFLAVGVAQDRKDTRRLVQAFCEAFPKNLEYPPIEPGFPLKCSQVELVLKSNNFGELDWVNREGYSNIANIRTIFTGWYQNAQRKDYTMQEMYDLYTSCDCLVHPSHGEGIGMPILEAAATGMPVIFTNWSSPSEYMNDSNSYPCSLGPNGTDMIPAYCGAGPTGENGLWANINIGHMKHYMYEVIRERDRAREKGKAAADLIKKKYNWQEAARYLTPLLFEWDEERKRKTAVTSFDPLTFEKPKLSPIVKGDRILIDIVTRDRHGYLCSLLTSLLGQTFKEWDIVIECDDADETMPNDHQIMSLMHRCMHEGHGWRIIRSHRQGPHMAHDRTLQMAKDDPHYKYKLICRIDDDIYVRPDYLEKLFAVYQNDPEAEIAAVSGVYLDPRRSEQEQAAPAGYETDINYAGKIEPNVPWPYICKYPAGTKPRPVEHLYSSFLYRLEAAVAIGGYCKRFSQIGHREESDFSYRFHLAGWKQYIQPEAIGFHYCAPAGGIRSQTISDKNELAMSDHKIYERRLQRWKKRAELRRKRGLDKKAAVALPTVDVTVTKSRPDKIAAVINGGKDIEKTKAAIKRFESIADEIYVTSEAVNAKEWIITEGKVKMVATAMEETALLTKALLAEGDHDFIMTVTDLTHFSGNPRELLIADYDDYVFEVFKTYIPGRFSNGNFVEDKSIGTTIGPECRNLCLITRRRNDSAVNLQRTLYCDMYCYEDENNVPNNGSSLSGNPLIPLSMLDKMNWKKICNFQFPKGFLDQPLTADMVASNRLVSIIIPTAGRKELLRQCIDSIYSYTSTPFELIIIDNNSNDGTKEYLEQEMRIRPSLKIHRQPVNLGYQKAINIGISKARGEYVMLFNDDAWVTDREPDGRDWLQVYVDELKSNPKIGLVGPHGGDSPALGGRILYFWCVMFRKSLYEKVGPLDDVTFKNYGGDDDYCERIRAAGFELKEKVTKLRHLMNQVPENVKKPELAESVLKLRAKYGKKVG